MKTTVNKLEKYRSGFYDDCGDFKAFHPSEINHPWVWEDRNLNYLLAEANKEIGGLNTYAELVDNIDLYIMMHIQVEANKSNRIEGTKTSIEDDLMDLEDVLPEKRDDVQEIQNYVRAMHHGIHRIVDDDFPFTTRLIKELHQILLSGVRGEHKTPGEFRRSQNFIGGSMPSNAIYVPPTVAALPDLLGDFDKFINANDNVPALIKIAMLHYQFESIHPFLDGNGRLGRLIIPLFLLSKKELAKPCFYISDYFERNREEYYSKLQDVRINSNMIPWISFFLEATIETARSAKSKFRKAIQLQDEHNVYLMEKRSSSSSLHAILESMYSNPVTTVADLCKITGLSAPTVNKAVSILVDDGILHELTGNRRNRIFALIDYMHVFE